MLTRDNLHDNQKLAINLIYEHERLGLWMEMGAGKTVTVLTALEDLNLVDDVYPALVIGPLRVARSVWPKEPAEWEHLQHLYVSPILGTPAQRQRALRVAADIYSINRENVPWLVDTLGDEWPFKTIVYDESSRLGGFRTRQGSAQAKALSKVAFRSKRFIELTGSPAAGGLEKLWGQSWFVDQGKRLGKTFTAFETRWFKIGYDGFSREPMRHAQAEIQQRLSDKFFTIPAPVVDKPITVPIWVDLPSKARGLYYDMEKEFFIALENGEVEAANAAVKSQRLLELANGAIYTNEEHDWETVHDAKLEALDSLIEECNGKPILLSYCWVHDRERILKRYKFARFLDKKQSTIDDWNAGKIQLLVAHPASAGHGLSLQHGGHILARFGVSWSHEEHEQILERIGPRRQAQSGYQRPVYDYQILARDTLDESVIARHATRKSVQQILLEAMLARKVDKAA